MHESPELTATLPPELAGKRLDQALACTFPAYSRSRIQHWIKHGQIRINNGTARPRDRVRGGEQVVLIAATEPEVAWRAQPLPLNIVYEDDTLIVINKPAGLVVHPAAGHLEGTLVNALLHHAPELEEIPRAGIVHRLDKDTSGLLVIARTLPAHHALVRQLQARQVTREYRAITVGVMIGGGTINSPIGRHPVDRKRMAIRASGKPALTHYRVVARFRGHTYTSCRLETGRTHQIRVHLASIGYPIVGDPAYGKRICIPKGSSEELIAALQNFKRQALHATRLAFIHPLSDEEVSWEAPPPEDMAILLNVLERDC